MGMVDFKIGDKVKVQMGAIFIKGSVGISETANDIFGNPIGKVKFADTLIDDDGKIIGNVTMEFKPVFNQVNSTPHAVFSQPGATNV